MDNISQIIAVFVVGCILSGAVGSLLTIFIVQKRVPPPREREAALESPPPSPKHNGKVRKNANSWF
jgi:hypothetical protein